MKRTRGSSSRSKTKRQRTMQLLDVMRKTTLNTIVNRVTEKMGVSRDLASKLLQALNTLDMKFDETNWKNVEKILEQATLTEIEWEIVNNLEKSNEAKVIIDQNTRVAQATSKVLLDCTYQGDDCVVKVMETSIDKVDLFIESIINIFMSAAIDDEFNKFISSPDIITMGITDGLILGNARSMYSYSKKVEKINTKQLILIQEKISGMEFSKITDGRMLRTAIMTLCNGMKILQEKYNFAHRDFHSSNVMYDPVKDLVYIIDFGYSCFSIADTTKGSIQALEGGYGYDQTKKDYKAHIPCINRSHDLCVLILSLLTNPTNRTIPWLYKLGIEISALYKIFYKNPKDGWVSMDEEIEDSFPAYSFDSDIIHYWYLYEMFEIDIGMRPDVILKRLQDVTEEYMGAGTPVYKELKF